MQLHFCWIARAGLLFCQASNQIKAAGSVDWAEPSHRVRTPQYLSTPPDTCRPLPAAFNCAMIRDTEVTTVKEQDGCFFLFVCLVFLFWFFFWLCRWCHVKHLYICTVGKL